MDTHTVLAATPLPAAPDWWSVLLRLPPEPGFPAGRQHEHRFPHEALHWRAAEYGIDPADSNTLLHIVLYEPHMSDHSAKSPDFLYNTDQESARTAHLNRVGAAMTRVDIQDPGGHLAAIHAAHVVDFAAHVKRVDIVAGHRAGNHVPNTTLARR